MNRLLLHSRLYFHRLTLLLGAGVALGVSPLHAELKLPAIFGDHMVLQQENTIPVWGWADPADEVTVTFEDQTIITTANAEGKWRVDLPAFPSNKEAASLKVSTTSGDEIIYTDVLVGDVWLCSGQSNMQWGVNQSNNAKTEIAAANYPEIRLFTVKHMIGYEKATDVVGKWLVCSPETVGNFSAVGYFFGRHLNQQLQQPIGLISANWGGTIAEAWTSAETLHAQFPEFSETIENLPTAASQREANTLRYKEEKKAYQAEEKKLIALEADLESSTPWALPSLDDSDWATMTVPNNWENDGFPNLDGMVWLRKTITIPEAWAGRDLVLETGPIDEIDVTWFDGVIVGQAGSYKDKNVSAWNKPRNYKIPGSAVTAGQHVIAIRVIDANYQGGLWSKKPTPRYVAPVDAQMDEAISLEGEWKIKPEFELPAKPKRPNGPNVPTVLYKGMIAPIVPYGIKGVIWYQGESNTGRAQQYYSLLPALIGDWRKQWNQGDFPFLVVQLANFQMRAPKPSNSSWAELREAQAMTAANDPNVGLALTIDIGEAGDIHPRNKQDVGLRLGLQAERIAYDRDVIADGPTFSGMEIVGNEVILSFDHAEGGIRSVVENPGGFAIRGTEGDFVWADQLLIEGNTITLSAESVATPVAVRYGWANNPEASFYNQAGLPMAPFRTDVPEAE
ncbi:sialate O-acetylesterase [Kiritimatiellota bacterium B12222]|nr:sialate O-acetylesterase [Kiritimatiellota bacterium B12222]